jgi:hypothetical protein
MTKNPTRKTTGTLVPAPTSRLESVNVGAGEPVTADQGRTWTGPPGTWLAAR